MLYEIHTTYECEETTVGKLLAKLEADKDIYCMADWGFIDPKEPVDVFDFVDSWAWLSHRSKKKKILIVKEIKSHGRRY